MRNPPVYSQNIVGYVNTVLPGSGVYSMIANPLNGTTNAAEAVLPALVGGENLLKWNGAGYYIYSYAGAGVGTGLGFQSDWTDGGSAPPAPPSIPGDQTDTSDGIYWAPRSYFDPWSRCFPSKSQSHLHEYLHRNCSHDK